MLKNKYFKSLLFGFYLAKYDLTNSYRRSIFGPFWLTIHAMIFVTAISYLWSTILGYSDQDYMVYMSSGYIFWWLISEIINSGTSVLIKNKRKIINTDSLFLIYTRSIFKIFFTHLHHWIFLIVFIFIHDGILNINFLQLFFSYIVFFLCVFNFYMFISIISARFHDIGNLIKSLMSLMFFVTPIVWVVDSHKVPSFITDLNPFYYLIQLLRMPILGNSNLYFILITLLFVIFFSAINFILIKKNFTRIYYWLN